MICKGLDICRKKNQNFVINNAPSGSINVGNDLTI